MSQNFVNYTISGENIDLLLEDPFKYWLLLGDEESYIEAWQDEKDIEIDSKNIQTIVICPEEARRVEFEWSIGLYRNIDSAIQNFEMDARQLLFPLAIGDLQTNNDLGWSKSLSLIGYWDNHKVYII